MHTVNSSQLFFFVAFYVFLFLTSMFCLVLTCICVALFFFLFKEVNCWTTMSDSDDSLALMSDDLGENCFQESDMHEEDDDEYDEDDNAFINDVESVGDCSDQTTWSGDDDDEIFDEDKEDMAKLQQEMKSILKDQRKKAQLDRLARVISNKDIQSWVCLPRKETPIVHPNEIVDSSLCHLSAYILGGCSRQPSRPRQNLPLSTLLVTLSHGLELATYSFSLVKKSQSSQAMLDLILSHVFWPGTRQWGDASLFTNGYEYIVPIRLFQLMSTPRSSTTTTNTFFQSLFGRALSALTPTSSIRKARMNTLLRLPSNFNFMTSRQHDDFVNVMFEDTLNALYGHVCQPPERKTDQDSTYLRLFTILSFGHLQSMLESSEWPSVAMTRSMQQTKFCLMVQNVSDCLDRWTAFNTQSPLAFLTCSGKDGENTRLQSSTTALGDLLFRFLFLALKMLKPLYRTFLREHTVAWAMIVNIVSVLADFPNIVCAADNLLQSCRPNNDDKEEQSQSFNDCLSTFRRVTTTFFSERFQWIIKSTERGDTKTDDNVKSLFIYFGRLAFHLERQTTTLATRLDLARDNICLKQVKNR